MRIFSLLSIAIILAAADAPVLGKSDGQILAALNEIDPEIARDHYEAAEVDLDDDGMIDALALMNGRSAYSGSGGSNLFVLRRAGGKFSKVGAIRVVHRPVYVRKGSHHGMRDLLVRVAGGGVEKPYFAALSFDGKSYPISPGEGAASVADSDVVVFPDGEGALALGFEQAFSLQGVSFKVTCANDTAANKLRIEPGGLQLDNAVIEREIDGIVTGAEVGDLDANGSPEIYVYIAAGKGGRYGKLVGYASNNKKSLSEIHLPEITDDVGNSKGYRGYDEFAVVEDCLARRFPLFPEASLEDGPTGKMRQLQYKLKAGEAGWILRLDRATEF